MIKGKKRFGKDEVIFEQGMDGRERETVLTRTGGWRERKRHRREEREVEDRLGGNQR